MTKQNNIRRWSRAVAVVAATSLVLIACGSDDDSADTTVAETASTDGDAPDTTDAADTTDASDTTDAADTTDAPEPGEPFKIGAIGTYSGPIALIGAEAGVKAWADDVNAKGGINGHPVELTTRDDSGDPALALTQAKELVEQIGVIAIVGQASAPAPAIAQYLDEQGIPIIGGLDTGEPFFSDPNWFAVGGSYELVGAEVVDLIKQRGGTKVGVIACVEAPTCEETLNSYVDIVADAGLELVYSELVPLTAPDYTAQCLAADAAGVDAIITSLTSAAQINVYESCVQQGMDFLKVGIGSSVSADFLDVPALDGYVGAQIVFPFQEASTPATEEFQRVIAEYAPDAVVNNIAIGAFTAMTYVSGKMFELAVAAGDLGDGATAADVKAAMYKIPADETLGGLIPATTYVDGEPTVVPCYFIQEIHDGAFTSPNGLETICLAG